MMMYKAFVFSSVCVALTSCFSIYQPGAPRPFVVSKRDSSSRVTVDSLLDTIRSTLEQARKGIKTDELAEAAQTVTSEVAQLLKDQKVKDQAVNDLIANVSNDMPDFETVSALFDSPLITKGNNIALALSLMSRLVEETQRLKASGQATATALAAIAKTAHSLGLLVKDSVAMIKYIQENNSAQDETRRSHSVDLSGYHYNNGGFSFNAKPTFNGGLGFQATATYRW